MTKLAIRIFDHAHPKNFSSAFYFHESVRTCKKSVIPSVHSSDEASFRVPRPYWPSPFLTMPNQKFFNQLLIFVNLYQHGKNEAISSICS